MRRLLLTMLTVFVAWIVPGAGAAFVMPDTGQTKCYNNTQEIPCPSPGSAFYGQDAQYVGPQRSYTKLGHGGAVLPDSASQGDGWIMTRDNATGLIWENKTDDGTIHDRDITHDRLQADAVFITSLNQQNFGGFSDWRLPHIKELTSLLHYGRSFPFVDTEWFPFTPDSYYWTATPSLSGESWIVSMYTSHWTPDSNSKQYAVRAVRGEQISAYPLVDNGDMTVNDPNTGLMWQKVPWPSLRTWQEALSDAESLSIAGYNDWRLPNITELQTLVDYTRAYPAVDFLLKSFTANAEYWSSTTGAGAHLAHTVNFAKGGSMHFKKDAKKYVRAVRGVQTPPPSPDGWKTEVGIISAGNTPLAAVLRGFNADGQKVWEQNVFLGPQARRSMDVGHAARSVAPQIKYMRLDISSGQAVGYQKFSQRGKFRVGLEALPQANQGELFIPHVASNDFWWTGIALVNTLGTGKLMHFAFSDGQQRSRALSAKGHLAFSIADMFAGAEQPTIGSARVSSGNGIVGLQLFGSEKQLSGINLNNSASPSPFFPHVAQTNGWWTGFGIYNPNGVAASVTQRVFDSGGKMIQETQGIAEIPPYGKFVQAVDMPGNAASFKMISTVPIMGFQLFGRESQDQLAGFSVSSSLPSGYGIFPKIEKDGWTGIAIVNVGAQPTSFYIEGWDDSGNKVANSSFITLQPYAKYVDVITNVFPGQDLTDATYIAFSADQPMVGFQLNGSADGTMLDAIPALTTSHVGTQQLYFPHIAAGN